MKRSLLSGIFKHENYENVWFCILHETHFPWNIVFKDFKIFDDDSEVQRKTKILAEWIRNSRHVVAHTGAGISTSAGIPDFRGPKGVWTLEEKGEKPMVNLSFDDAIPTKTHMALLQMIEEGIIHHVISQNVDGLHLKSGLHRKRFSELHGNMLLDKCGMCRREFVRNTATKSVAQKLTGRKCPLKKSNGRRCRGNLHDTILDWEDELPQNDLDAGDNHSRKADLSITLGSSLQIVPSGNLPLLCKKKGGKLVICNLQPTKHDKHADLIIHSYVDNIMELLAKYLDFKIPDYDVSVDPTKVLCNQNIDVLNLECKAPQMTAMVLCKDEKIENVIFNELGDKNVDEEHEGDDEGNGTDICEYLDEKKRPKLFIKDEDAGNTNSVGV